MAARPRARDPPLTTAAVSARGEGTGQGNSGAAASWGRAVRRQHPPQDDHLVMLGKATSSAGQCPGPRLVLRELMRFIAQGPPASSPNRRVSPTRPPSGRNSFPTKQLSLRNGHLAPS